MANVWYITFHGGSDNDDYNNIHVYDADGNKINKALDKDSLTQNVDLRELRGMTFGPDGDLYVVNAYKNYSQILRFQGTLDDDDQHEFVETFTQRQQATNPAIYHPYTAMFGPDGNIYISNQDSNVVSRYFGPDTTTCSPGAIVPLPSALSDSPNNYYPGTFVPSSEQEPEGGLQEVRAAIWGPDGNLYVSDRDANAVKKYDGTTGAFLGAVVDTNDSGLENPIYLVFSPDGANLYVGNSGQNNVLQYNMKSGTVDIFIEAGSGGLDAPAGLAFGNDGWFYVASRKGDQILRYSVDDGTPDDKPFIDDLDDNPEIIMLVNQIKTTGAAG